MSGQNGKGGEPGGLVVLLGALTAFASVSIDMYLPAFPAIGKELGVSLAVVEQTLAVFFFGMAAGQLLYGPLSDRFGRKKPLLAGLFLYITASVACALARDATALIFWRLLQGLGGCAGIVIARAVVRDLFGPTHAARVFSELMMVMGAAPILAPFIGGQLLIFSTWRSLFWVLAAFGTICFLAVLRTLPESWTPDPKAGRPTVVARTFWSVLCDRTFLFPALTVALAQAAMFTYILGSPAVFIEHFGVASRHYGFFFGANAIGLIVASQLNRKVLLRMPPEKILDIAIPCATGAGLLVAVVGWFEIGGLWGLATALFLFLFCLGFLAANGAARALANQGARAGSASALMGMLQFALAAAAGAGSSHLPSLAAIGTPMRGMCAFIALCVTASAVIHALGGRWFLKNPAKAA